MDNLKAVQRWAEVCREVAEGSTHELNLGGRIPFDDRHIEALLEVATFLELVHTVCMAEGGVPGITETISGYDVSLPPSCQDGHGNGIARASDGECVCIRCGEVMP